MHQNGAGYFSSTRRAGSWSPDSHRHPAAPFVVFLTEISDEARRLYALEKLRGERFRIAGAWLGAVRRARRADHAATLGDPEKSPRQQYGSGRLQRPAEPQRVSAHRSKAG